MRKIRLALSRLTVLWNTCPAGHKSVYMKPNGKQYCMDCGAEW